MIAAGLLGAAVSTAPKEKKDVWFSGLVEEEHLQRAAGDNTDAGKELGLVIKSHKRVAVAPQQRHHGVVKDLQLQVCHEIIRRDDVLEVGCDPVSLIIRGKLM